MPSEWWVSVVCEAFSCTPLVALGEIQHAPAGLLEDILELRAYARVKHEMQQATEHRGDMPTGPLADIATEIIEAQVLAEFEARRGV